MGSGEDYITYFNNTFGNFFFFCLIYFLYHNFITIVTIINTQKKNQPGNFHWEPSPVVLKKFILGILLINALCVQFWPLLDYNYI